MKSRKHAKVDPVIEFAGIRIPTSDIRSIEIKDGRRRIRITLEPADSTNDSADSHKIVFGR